MSFIEKTSLIKSRMEICAVLSFQESERVVTKKEGIDFARQYGCLFLECSAKTRVNVEQCFEELVLKVWKSQCIWCFICWEVYHDHLLILRSGLYYQHEVSVSKSAVMIMKDCAAIVNHAKVWKVGFALCEPRPFGLA